MRIDERRGQVKEAKAGPERQDQKEGCAVAISCRPPGDQRTDSLFKGDSLDVFGPSNDGVGLKAIPGADAELKSTDGERIRGALEINRAPCVAQNPADAHFLGE